MTHLIDTDVVISHLYGRIDPSVLPELRRGGIAISVLTLMEIAEGIEGGRTPRRARQGFRRFLRGTRVLVVSRAIGERAAAVRLDLRRQRRQVNERVIDILIASTALEHDLTLVTRNIRDYQDIPGLRLQALP